MSADYTFQGWLAKSPESANGKMEWGTFEPKTWTEDDVDIQITHCGICGSDMHTLRSGWGATNYPCCVGHEIVGKAVRVGSNVKHVKPGDRVGVGAQALSCLEPDCPECSSGQEAYCKRLNLTTYNAKYPGDQGWTYGGYADYNRTHGRFVFKIPDGLPSEHAAPMLCAGVTMFSPLRRGGVGPGKSVGIVGLGGLGHFGVLFAKALGADRVVAISRRAAKRDEALALGADEYIATADDEDWAAKHQRSLDLIICTVSSNKMPLADYIGLLRLDGEFVQVGVPDGGHFAPIMVTALMKNRIRLTSSFIGSPQEIEDMFKLAVEKKIVPWVESRPMAEANQAILDMDAGLPRYRYVLVNGKHIEQ